MVMASGPDEVRRERRCPGRSGHHGRPATGVLNRRLPKEELDPPRSRICNVVAPTAPLAALTVSTRAVAALRSPAPTRISLAELERLSRGHREPTLLMSL